MMRPETVWLTEEPPWNVSSVGSTMSPVSSAVSGVATILSVRVVYVPTMLTLVRRASLSSCLR